MDAKDLKISKIILDNETKQELKYSISEPKGEFGSKLSVELPKQGDSYTISIFYENSANASGLQWLTPEQTAGKKQPYLFSQFQVIVFYLIIFNLFYKF